MSFHRRTAMFLTGALIVVGASSLVHPFGDVRTTLEAKEPLLEGAQVPQEVKSILETKCGDCHSQRTAWHAYSRVAPGSWLIERDVYQGRAHLNLSRWQQYSFDDQQGLLQRIASESRSGDMPPKQYTLIHRQAKLSPEEAQKICDWAKGERKRVKTDVSNTLRRNDEGWVP